MDVGFHYVLRILLSWNRIRDVELRSKKVGAPHAVIYQNIIPLVAVLSAWLMIDEIPLALQIWGRAMNIAGLVIMRRGR